MPRMRAGRLSLVGFLAVSSAVGAAVVAQGRKLPQADARVVDAVVVTAFVVAGAVVLRRRPGHRVGLVLWIGGVLWGSAALALELATATLAEDGDRPAAALVAVLAMGVRAAGWILVVGGLPLLFPDGRLPSPRWRPAGRLLAAAVVVFVAAVVAAPEPLDYRLAGVDNPIGLPARWRTGLDLLALTGLGLVVASTFVGLTAVAVRWRRGDGLLRQQVGALVTATTVCAGTGVWIVADGGASAVAFSLAVAPLPVAVGFAVLQHGLYDVRLAVNRTLAYVLLTGAVVAVYVLVVGAFGAVVQGSADGWLPVAAAGVVAVLFQPLREAVQRSVNRVTYGAWDQPAEVVRRLGNRLADSVAPDVTLPVVADSLAEALRLPYVAIVDRAGTPLAERGHCRGEAREVPLVHQGERVGTLRLTADSPPGPLGRARRRAAVDRLLEVLAAQLAPVVRALELSRQLQTSRERLVLLREEERRRLRRDLHDGLGPSLAGLALRVDTARNTIGGDPGVDRVLLELRGEVQEAVADVRRVVEDLRPAALDDLGLPRALEVLATRLGAGPLTVVVDAAAVLPRLPAAIEVAAYRIAQEAVTNAVRHAGAAAVLVRLDVRSCPAGLALTVEDDGAWRPPAAGSRRGNGLTTMRERAEELGGVLAVGSGRHGGTVVSAVLPLPVESGRTR